MDRVPERFRPVGYGTPAWSTRGDKVISFLHVPRNTQLTALERNYLCGEVDDTVVPPPWEFQLTKKMQLCRRHDLSKDFFTERMKIYYHPYKDFHDAKGGGRPEMLLPSEQMLIGQKVQDAIDQEGAQLDRGDVKKLIFEGALRSKQLLGNKINSAWTEVHENTVDAFVKKHGIKLQVPDLHTEARNVACKCPRMTFVFFLQVYTFSRFLPAVRKWNFDGVTYVFEAVQAGAKFASLKETSNIKEAEIDAMDLMDADAEDEMPDLVSAFAPAPRRKSKSKNTQKKSELQGVVGSSQMAFGIKNMHLANAGGQVDKPCLLIGVKDMPEGVFFVRQVTGLTWTTDQETRGTLYISRTRCGSTALWKHYFLNQCLPFIKQSNDLHSNYKVRVILLFFKFPLLFCLYFKHK